MKAKRNIKLICTLAIALVVTTAISFGVVLNSSKTEAHATSGITSLEVALVWSDNVEPHMGQSANVVLYQNGAIASSVDLSIGNCGQCKWEGLDPNSNYDIQQTTGFPGYYTQYHGNAADNVTIENIQNGSPVPPWPSPQPGEETWEDIGIPIPGGDTPVGGGTNSSQNESANNSSNNSGNSVIEDVTPLRPKIDTSDDADNNIDMGPFFSFIGSIALPFLLVIGIAVLFIVEAVSAKKKNRR